MRYRNDFESETVGILPPSFAEPIGSLRTVVTCVLDVSNKILRVAQTLTGFYQLDLGLGSAVKDQKIILKTRSDASTGDQMGVVLRGSDAGTGYYAVLAGGDTFEIGRFDSEVKTSLQSVSFNWNVDDWYRIKFSVSGTQLNAKVWADTEDEPQAWNMVADDDTISAGYPGLYKASIGITDYDDLTVDLHNKRKSRKLRLSSTRVSI